MIKFENVTYSYHKDGSHPVLDGFNLEIRRGEQLAIMGGNGCGKTTLGMMLCGLIEPQKGTVSFGDLLNNSDTIRIGFLFQDPDNGLVATTVEREVAFSLENQNLPPLEIKDKVFGTLKDFDLFNYRKKLVWNLSGGEKQRLSLAGLFASQPRILFLDEPASFLDFSGACQLEENLAEVKNTQKDLIIIRITQYPQVAEDYSRVVVINDGKVTCDDSPKALFSNHRILSDAGIRPPLSYLEPELEIPKTKGSLINENDNSAYMTLDNVSFSYDKKSTEPIINNLDLTLSKGKIIGLVGKSGCGKSTLAQIICGIYKPDNGSINLRIDDAKAVMTFQQPERQFFLSTSYEEVEYGIRGDSKSNPLIDETIESSFQMSGLDYESFKERDPHTLSGGEARRLAFAIILALNSEIVVFDEPTCGLDEDGIQKFIKMVRLLKNRDKTIVIISHNGDIIGELADEIALLENGRIDYWDSPLRYFISGKYKGVLSPPEVIEYQKREDGDIFTSRMNELFSLESFNT